MADIKPTDAELKAAEHELEEQSEALSGHPLDRLLGLLVEWDGFESKRLAAQEKYALRNDLPGIDLNALVNEYATAKKAVIALENRMAYLLEKMSVNERMAVLRGDSFIYQVPGFVRTVALKPNLAERLASKLPANTPVNGTQQPKE